VVIATQSRILPVPTNVSSFPTEDLAVQFDLATPFTPQEFLDSSDWEHWGKEPIIELCEVRLGFNGFSLRKFLLLHKPSRLVRQLYYQISFQIPFLQYFANLHISASL
jgi:hypothetical protein